MGRVLLPGPEVKLEITRSSQDSVKASSHPDRMAGKMIGSVMTKNTFSGRAPKSMAASSSAVSKVAMRELHDHRDIGHGKGHVPDGHGGDAAAGGPADGCSKATNNSSRDKPVITSGMTKGAVVMAFKVKRPRNCAEARQAESGERAQDHRARGIDHRHLQRNPGRIENLLVVEQRVIPLEVGELAESHTVTSLEALKENTTMDRIGM
jgi:hypothetical protein